MEIDEANIDPYDQLGLTPTATEKEVRSAYRKKSREVHPDRVRLHLHYPLSFSCPVT